MSKCKECGKNVSINEMGLNYKMISRELDEFLCIDCLAKKFNLSKKLLEDKIDYFISIGCEMFSKDKCNRVDGGN